LIRMQIMPKMTPEERKEVDRMMREQDEEAKRTLGPDATGADLLANMMNERMGLNVKIVDGRTGKVRKPITK
jgi:hypothetical protein